MGATGLEMVVALYDAAIRSRHRAMQCCEEHDTIGRRRPVKKVVDIFMYLQARLRPDVGGQAALGLADFYATTFTMTLEASHIASTEQFADVIGCVRNVRDAWAIAAQEPNAGRVLPRELRTREEAFLGKGKKETAPAGVPEARRRSRASRLSRIDCELKKKP